MSAGVHDDRATQEDERLIRWRRLAWSVLAASCIAYLAISLAHHQAFHPFGRRDYFDLRVYRGAAHLIWNGRPLYAGAIWQWAPFTYPPFAAIAFAPLALLPLTLDELLVTGLGVVCLFLALSRALRLPSGAGPQVPSQGWRSPVLAVAAAAALWLEPITTTLGYGQVDLLIACLIVWDLSCPDTARSKGVLIGCAAGLKLTPLIFVPYLFLSGRRRAALIALATTAATVALGYMLLADDTWQFWGGMFLDPGRAGRCCVPANQSLRGAVLQTVPLFGSDGALLIALLVGAGGVVLAARASLRGEEALGFSLCAITGLLVSPVSWTHHWSLAVPALLLVGVRAARDRSWVAISAFVAILLVGFSYLPTLMARTHAPTGGVLAVLWTLASAPYVLIGLGALAVASVREIRALRRPALRLRRVEMA